MKEGGNDRLG